MDAPGSASAGKAATLVFGAEQVDNRGLSELAYTHSLRTLDLQQAALEDLRARTGTLLAAAALVASFLGGTTITRDGFDVWTALALGSLVTSTVFATRVLLPQTGLIFSIRGSALYEGEEDDRSGIAETHRRLAYWLEDFYDRNAPGVNRLFLFYRLAIATLLAEIAFWSIQLALS